MLKRKKIVDMNLIIYETLMLYSNALHCADFCHFVSMLQTNKNFESISLVYWNIHTISTLQQEFYFQCTKIKAFGGVGLEFG